VGWIHVQKRSEISETRLSLEAATLFYALHASSAISASTSVIGVAADVDADEIVHYNSNPES
jgi:hypothetical protein